MPKHLSSKCSEQVIAYLQEKKEAKQRGRIERKKRTKEEIGMRGTKERKKKNVKRSRKNKLEQEKG